LLVLSLPRRWDSHRSPYIRKDLYYPKVKGSPAQYSSKLRD
jgi:hypothetical protein